MIRSALTYSLVFGFLTAQSALRKNLQAFLSSIIQDDYRDGSFHRSEAFFQERKPIEPPINALSPAKFPNTNGNPLNFVFCY